MKAIDLRSLARQGLLPASELGAIAQGFSLLAWNGSHRFCPKCGGETLPRDGGYRRQCTACESDLFPRTDPVVIMLAIHEDRCLMARNASFPGAMFSALAGFVEPGETIEDAVRRETLEESAIRIGRVRYHASQPWPFPHSLMIGCYGEALSEDITIDDKEIAECRWFTRNEVRAALSGDESLGFFVPPPMSIAHHLIRYWADNG